MSNPVTFLALSKIPSLLAKSEYSKLNHPKNSKGLFMNTKPQPRTRTATGLIFVLAIAASLFGAPQQTQLARPALQLRPTAPSLQASKARRPINSRALKAYGNLPMRFEENRGQTDPHVQFFARGAGYSLFLMPSEAVLALHTSRHVTPGDLKMGKRRGRTEREKPQNHDTFVRMKLAGANPATRPSRTEALPGITNYIC